jgi:MarR family transcriptional regulator, organic hydroperoxide resistance regulator
MTEEYRPVVTRRSTVAKHGPLSFSVFALSRAHRACAAQMLRGMGLHPGQEVLLMQLLDRDGQTQSELLDAVGLDHSTVSKSLRRMQEAGLLTREPAEHDRRLLRVHLTEKGRSMREPIDAMWSRLEQVSVAGLGEDAVRQFVAMAETIERSIVSHSATQLSAGGGTPPESAPNAS